MTAAAILLAASATIALVLGSLHLLLTFRGERLYPRDASLIAQMQQVSPRISRETTIWRAGLGFHASHSLGAMWFGLMHLYLALQAASVFFASWFLMTLGFLYLATMTWLARHYWFSVPFRAIATALLLYVAGVAAHALGPLTAR